MIKNYNSNYKSSCFTKTNETFDISFHTKRKIYFTKFTHGKKTDFFTVLFLLFATLFSFNIGNAQTTTIYNTPGAKSWVCPYGMTSVQVEAWGGGAGGRSSANTNGFVGGGGGGGSYAKRNSIPVTGGTTYNFTVTLGTGGGANTAGGATSTTFNTVAINAPGGSVGVASAAGIAVAGGLGGILGTGDVTYLGGNGGSGYGVPNAGSGGGGGSAAGTTGAGNPGGNATATNTPGAGGAARALFGGAGGAGGNNANGVAATINYGGGGGGAGHKGNLGGAGMDGALIITFTCPTETASAGPDQSLACGATTATLAGNAPSSAGLTGTWTVISGTATITSINSPTSGVTGLASSGTATLRWTINNGLCGTSTDDVIITSKATSVITTNPINSSIAVGANTSFTVVGLNTPTSYIWEVSTDGGGSWSTVTDGGVYTNATTATLNITGATFSMSGYKYRAKAVNACGTSAASTEATLTVILVYCTPSVSAAGYESLTYFTNVSFVGTLLDTSNNSTFSSAPRGYQDFTGLPTLSQQAQGEGVNISTQVTNRGYMKAWVDWNKDGDFLDLGEDVYSSGGVATYSTTFGFVIPATQPVGNYRVRIRINKDDNTAPYDPGAVSVYTACQVLSYYGEAEDYLFTVIPSCNALITGTTNGSTCGAGTTTLLATGNAGVTQYRWYTTPTGGAPVATTATGSWTTPSISSTTLYYVTAFNGTCESLVRTLVKAIYNPNATLSFTPSNPEVCGENVIISITVSGDTEQAYLIDENFEGGMGTFTNVNYNNIYGATVATNAAWQSRTSTYVPINPPGQVWFPAISSGFGTNKFVSSTSDLGSYNIHTGLVSATVNSTTFTDLTLTFDTYYSRYYIDGANLTLDYVTVDVSTNGGGAWTEIQRYTSDIAIGTRMQSLSYNLNAYINQANLKVRVRYYGEWCDGIAIDNVKLFGTRPLNTSFTWSGASLPDAFVDAAATIPYTAGTPIVSVYIKPTLAQLELGTYTFTASATLANGCIASTPITVTNTSRVWKGTTDTDWNTASNWLPATVPTSANCVIIPSNTIISGAGFNAYGKNLTIKSTGNLELQSSNNLTITDFIKNESGVFNVRNSANLVQINNIPNTGNITMQRIANIRKQDYVYWSSPVASFATSAISPGTTSSYIYKWTPTIGTNTNGWGNWTGGSETMTLGKGYIVRGPDAFSLSLFTNYTANYVGVPNNGTITMPVLRGTYDGANYSTGVSTTLATKDDDNWNLLGNPYPSAINPTQFLAANTNLAGFVKIWTHGTLPVSLTDPFYQDFAYNYTPGDYVTYNGSGSTAGPGVNQISAGQGFFTLMNHTSAAASENVTFTNAMRRDGSGNTYNNSQFFKGTDKTPQENHRIWLDLVTATNKNVRTLLGYIDGATNETDRLYDAFTDEKLTLNLYSLIGTEMFNIQGKKLPFENTDFVPMGFKTNESGTHNIAIAFVDGLFSDASQNILIEDKLLNKTHNLKESAYTFTTMAGTFDDRFVLRYSKTNLSSDDFKVNNTVKVFANNNTINITSTSEAIKDVIIYDVLGKTIINKININKQEVYLNELKQTSTMLIVKVTLENNEVVVTKVIF
ncbi:GEVED domain-containing protein [Flavobacterium sp.]|uniref:GEVED domain-containing protein n=1 Tax=Flavobacterium sp. TaxID=239 RepID=UPI0037506CC6